MKRSFVQTLAAALLLLHSPTLAYSQAEQKPTLSKTWTALKSAWFGDKFRVRCAGGLYEVEKSMLGNIDLRWLNDQGNWLSLGILQISDEAIVYTGLGRQSPSVAGMIGRTSAKIKEVLSNPQYAGININHTEVKAAEDVFVMFQYTMNFAKSSQTESNIGTFKAYIEDFYDDKRVADFVVESHTAEGDSKCNLVE